MKQAITAGRAITVLLTVCAGCGEKRFGEELLTPASPPQARRLELPVKVSAQTPLNLHHVRRYASGAADAQGHANPDGNAEAKVVLNGKGAAWVEFEVGHVFAADALPPGSLTLRLAASSRYDVTTSADAPRGFLALKAVVLNSRRRVLARYNFRDVEIAQAARSLSGKEDAVLTFTVDEGAAYQVILAGRVEVDSGERSADAEVRLAVEAPSFELTAAP